MIPLARFRNLAEAGVWYWLTTQADERGEITLTLAAMSAEIGWDRVRCKRFLDWCEKQGFCNTKRNTAGTSISLLKGAFQPRDVTAPCNTQVDLFDEPDALNERAYAYRKPTALPQDFRLPKSWGEWAMEQGLSRQDVIDQAARFRGYWIDKGDTKRGRKKVWALAWRNWIRSPYRNGETAPQATDAALEAYAAKYMQ